MKFKFNALVAALALIASAGANATIDNSNTNLGNSSVFFVAIDNARTISLTVDLGVNLADFLQASPAGSTITTNNGTLTGAGTTASWAFGTNGYSLNHAAAVTSGNGWSDAFSTFAAAAGSDYKWAVVGADNVTGAISGTNTVFNRTMLSTGTPTQANITAITGSSSVSNGVAQFQSWATSTSAAGNHATVANGANTATTGGAFLWNAFKDQFGNTNLGWSNLSAVGATTNLFLSQQASNPVVFQIGSEYGVDTLLSADKAAAFTFDGATLTYTVAAVPEASTIAMMLAGLGAVGFVARRRKAA